VEAVIEDQKAKAVYEGRIRALDGGLNRLQRSDRLLIVLKLLIFFGGLFLVSQFFPKKIGFSLAVFAFFLILFVIVAVIHENVLRKIRLQKTLRQINTQEALALSGLFIEGLDGGAEFHDPNHFYTSDLDIFGERSLFHFLNRTVTSIGRQALALRLQNPAEASSLEALQDAVKELAGRLDFRQSLQACGLDLEDSGQKTEALLQLTEEKPLLLAKKTNLLWLYGLPLVTLAFLVLSFFGVPWPVFVFFVILQMALNKKTGRRVASLYRSTSRHFKILRAYWKILGEIEKEDFQSQRLAALRRELQSGESTASQAIKKLAGLLEWLDARNSPWIHSLLNNLLLWDLHCVYLVEKWKKRYAARTGIWLEVMGEIEALSSLANAAFNHPDWAFPQVGAGGFRIKASSLGHPLIAGDERISNDFSVDGPGNLFIITGPNMAGKSTFLRTVGINAALAFAGAPVCASAMDISFFQLITSMKTSDSLDQHLSLFYAELQRLKLVLDSIQSGPPVFFLIDEMLKGTNALDRHKGSVALIKQLLRNKATGIVATHDLDLAYLENDYPQVKNFHFDSFIKGDTLDFDFKLRPGICESFNALILMKKIGIDIDDSA
jgi:MutS domain V